LGSWEGPIACTCGFGWGKMALGRVSCHHCGKEMGSKRVHTYQHVSRTKVTPKASNLGTEDDSSYNAREMLNGEIDNARQTGLGAGVIRRRLPTKDEDGTYHAITGTSSCFRLPAGTSLSTRRRSSSHSLRERCGFPSAIQSMEM
jgi:hypothetical protein